jgi:hypothetical protein
VCKWWKYLIIKIFSAIKSKSVNIYVENPKLKRAPLCEDKKIPGFQKMIQLFLRVSGRFINTFLTYASNVLINAVFEH